MCIYLWYRSIQSSNRLFSSCSFLSTTPAPCLLLSLQIPRRGSMTSFGPYCVNTDAILSQPSVGAVAAGGATRCLCAHPAPASQPPITAYASRYFLQSDRDRSIYHNHKHGHQCLCYHSVYNRNRRQGAIHVSTISSPQQSPYSLPLFE